MAQTVLLIIVTVINLTLWFVFFARFKKTFSAEVMLHDIKDEVNKLLIEINRTTDQNITLIDSRIRDLKTLTDAADKRLHFLQTEQKERAREDRILQKLSGDAAADSKTKQAAKKYRSMQKNADDESGVQLSIDFEAYRVPEEFGEPAGPAEPTERAEPEVISSPKNEITVEKSVMRFYEDGMAVDDISKRLKLPIAQVQFIVDFYLTR